MGEKYDRQMREFVSDRYFRLRRFKAEKTENLQKATWGDYIAVTLVCLINPLNLIFTLAKGGPCESCKKSIPFTAVHCDRNGRGFYAPSFYVCDDCFSKFEQSEEALMKSLRQRRKTRRKIIRGSPENREEHFRRWKRSKDAEDERAVDNLTER
jgi:hypothetical protein